MDEIVIGIGINENKNTYFPIEKREEMIRELYKDEPRIQVMSYDCLTIDFAQEVEARFIVRGIRTVKDFEYEETIADINRKLAGIETILLFTEPELTCVSSTIVRELLTYNKDISQFIPKGMKMSTEDIMKRLRGPKGSKVNLTIVRRGVQDPLLFTVKRDKIPILSLDASYMIQPKTGYIRINRFGATTAEEFKKAMTSLQKQGMKDMILDLQGNGGGYLNAAIDLANEFLGQKELIVYTEGRTAKRSDFYAKGNGDFRNGRLIILVDEYTASASEIVSGAVQDWDRGIIVGRRSFGKGLVQRPIDLPDGSMIRLTIARYYTPSGRSIQKPYDSTVDYNKDLIERFNHGELMNADSIHFPDSLKVQTKKLGRTVYGGGGIMPDYFVPIDTTLYTDYHRNLVAKGAVIKFTMQFIEGHRKELANKYKKFESFDEKFVVDDDMLANLKEIGEKEGVKFNEEQYQKSLPLIKTQLKALIARDLWDMNEYFRVMNTTNESIQKALEILNSDEYQKKLK